jgi:universal stress protein E
MKEIRTILVAVKDPDAKALPAVTKALQIAKSTGARVELLHVISDPLLEIAGDSRRRKEFEDALLTRFTSRLEAIAARFRRQEVDVTTEVRWDFPIYEAVIRRAKRIGADLIVAERHATPRGSRWLLKFTDWELLRLSPVPVLLIKQQAAYRRPRILAALDPAHTFAKPAELDARILSGAF